MNKTLRLLRAFIKLLATFLGFWLLDGSFSVTAHAQRLLVGSFLEGAVKQYDLKTGAFLGDLIPSFEGGLDLTHDLAIGPDGALYVSGDANTGIKRYNLTTGAYIDDFIRAGAGGLANPTSFAFGPDGNLYVDSAYSNSVKRYNGTTGAFMGDVGMGEGLDLPVGLTFGSDGTLYVSSSGTVTGNYIINRYDITTDTFLGNFVIGGLGGLNGCFVGTLFSINDKYLGRLGHSIILRRTRRETSGSNVLVVFIIAFLLLASI